MLRLLFRPEVNLALSVIMFLGGVFLTVGRTVGLIGQNEPALVFHMSAWALIVSGYGNILVSVVRQEAANSQSSSPVEEVEQIILPGDDWITRHKRQS
jgi:hypothetical protein